MLMCSYYFKTDLTQVYTPYGVSKSKMLRTQILQSLLNVNKINQ